MAKGERQPSYKWTRLRDPELRGRLNVTIDRCRKIWAVQVLQHYTNHGVDHSERIRARLEEILPRLSVRLTDDELFILLNAVYLHDIGMQHVTYAFGDTLPMDPADLEKIRKVHNRASADWIRNSGHGSGDVPALGLFDDDYLDLIARVSEAHTGIDIATLPETVDRLGGTIRVRLLAALLIVADELDLDSSRVVMERLKVYPIPPASKEHWWKHHYVDRAYVDDNGHVRVSMAMPVAYDGLQARALARLVTRPLLKQLSTPVVHETLTAAGIDLTVDPPTVVLVDDGRKELLPPNVRVTPIEELREDDVAQLNAYAQSDIFPGTPAHIYGFNYLTMTPEERYKLTTAYQDAVKIMTALGTLKLDLLRRQLDERIDAEFDASTLTGPAKHFLRTRAILMLVAAVERQRSPAWMRSRYSPFGDGVTDEGVWDRLRETDGPLLFYEPGSYERWRGDAETSLARNKAAVERIEAMTAELSNNSSIMFVGTDSLARLDDPAALVPIATLSANVPLEQQEAFKALHEAAVAQAQAPAPVLGRLVVTVVADGQPVVGREVGIYSVETGYTLQKSATDKDGRATFDLPGGARYQIGTSAPSGASDHPLHGVSAPTTSFPMPAGTTTEHTISFYRVHGRVVAGDSHVAVGAVVALRTPQDALTDRTFRGPYATNVKVAVDPASGTFSLIAAPGRYEISISYGGNVRVREMTVGQGSLDVGDIVMPFG